MTEAFKSRTVNSEPPDPITERCIVQFYDPLLFPWERISEIVMAMERYNFPKLPNSGCHNNPLLKPDTR